MKKMYFTISATNLASSSGKISCLVVEVILPGRSSLIGSERRLFVFCNVRRLRHHSLIVIYAGNNEEYQIQEQYKLEYNFADKDPELWLKSAYPARYISEHLLPTVIKDESPAIRYWQSSPFSDGKDTSEKTVGDLHQWNGMHISPWQNKH
jgi:hypothetical protein